MREESRAIDIRPKEQEILAWALNSMIADLGHEIADTEKHDYREDLKERKSVLQAVLHKLR